MPILHIARNLILLGAVLLIVGCSSTIKTVPTDAPLPPIADSSSPEVPFDLKVIEAVNNGTVLGVLAELTPKTDWPSTDVVLKLYGLTDGEVVKTAEVRASEILKSGQNLQSGKPVQVSLQIPSDSISDYQVEALWGSDAREVRSVNQVVTEKQAPSLRLTNVEVESKLEPCSVPPCQRRFTIFGQLKNDSGATLNSVAFGVGFVWVPKEKGMASRESVSEETLTVTDLGLGAGEQQALELSIDRGVPQLPDGEYKPVIRIISFGG